MDERGSNLNTCPDFSCQLLIRIGPEFQPASCPVFTLEVHRPENETIYLRLMAKLKNCGSLPPRPTVLMLFSLIMNSDDPYWITVWLYVSL